MLDAGDRESEDPASLHLHNALLDGVCMHGILSFRLRLILIFFPSPTTTTRIILRKEKKHYDPGSESLIEAEIRVLISGCRYDDDAGGRESVNELLEGSEILVKKKKPLFLPS